MLENPQVLRTVQRLLQRRDRDRNIPAGVLQTGERYSFEPGGTAVQILRQAYNHGDAIAQSGAAAPFFLADRDSQFIRWIGKLDDAKDTVSARRAMVETQQDYAQLATQLLDLLRTLELAGGVRDVSDFIGSEGHTELAQWYGTLCQSVAVEQPKALEDKISRELQRRLDEARLGNTFKSWAARKDDAAVFSIGLAAGIAGLAVEGASALAVGGVVLGAIPVGKGLLKRLGFVAAEYNGPQWPYLYAFGKKASARRVNRLRRALRIARP